MIIFYLLKHHTVLFYIIEFNRIIDTILPISDSAKNVLRTSFQEIEVPKKHTIVRSHKIENYLYFIKNGMVRAYFESPDKDYTFWLGKEGDPYFL